LGIDSDNDSAFLNGHLVGWCEEAHIEFTRCRPYRKNDQAHIGEKLVALRQLIGYDRYESEEAFQLLEEIYADWRLLPSFFTPVRKLYDREQTPYRRVLASGQKLCINDSIRWRFRRRLEEKLRKLWGAQWVTKILRQPLPLR